MKSLEITKNPNINWITSGEWFCQGAKKNTVYKKEQKTTTSVFRNMLKKLTKWPAKYLSDNARKTSSRVNTNFRHDKHHLKSTASRKLIHTQIHRKCISKNKSLTDSVNLRFSSLETVLFTSGTKWRAMDNCQEDQLWPLTTSSQQKTIRRTNLTDLTARIQTPN